MMASYKCTPQRIEDIPAAARNARGIINDADAFVYVSTEYYQTIPPALTNMIIHFDTDIFSGKPAALVCYSDGVFGGCRAAMALRAFVAATGALTIPTILYIPSTPAQIDNQGAARNSHITFQAKRLIAHLDYCLAAFTTHRKDTG
ncbi:PREDICTED: uncharacterized protein LOC106820478, partial [Priapulus caudatus]|uniref:Uncharacterized protein LOC106820478 n=1 Tax=Priapulus caudatus TaxID=37621 RepID=A0ABM1F7Q6_PRICU